ncbi:hypothetical protein A2U01_0088771, partial [Trifolium medium]|nr:hypothetical protein [Trifolium medium]
MDGSCSDVGEIGCGVVLRGSEGEWSCSGLGHELAQIPSCSA